VTTTDALAIGAFIVFFVVGVAALLRVTWLVICITIAAIRRLARRVRLFGWKDLL